MKNLNHKLQFISKIISLAIVLLTSPLRASDLVVEHVLLGTSEMELSGAFIKDKKFYALSDNRDDHFIYELKIDFKKQRFDVAKAFDLRKVKGMNDYLEGLKKNEKFAKRFLDLEGAALCGDELFLANEGVRHVLHIPWRALSDGQSDFKVYDLGGLEPKLFEGEMNAGLEGVAVDCEKNVIYAAKERDPRGLYALDLQKPTKLKKLKDLAPSALSGIKVINPWKGGELMSVGEDFADLFFESSFVYALERNTYQIAKLDREAKLVERKSFFLSTIKEPLTVKDLYQSFEPFGLAEVLLLTPEHFIVGMDNNKSMLSAAARDYFKVSGGSGPVLIYFKR